MIIHQNIDRFELTKEIALLEKAGKIIKFILPEMIEHKPGNIFGVVITYLIVFDEL